MKYLVLFSMGFGLACAGVLSWVIWSIHIYGGRWEVHELNPSMLHFEIYFIPFMASCCGVSLIYLLVKLFRRNK